MDDKGVIDVDEEGKLFLSAAFMHFDTLQFQSQAGVVFKFFTVADSLIIYCLHKYQYTILIWIGMKTAKYTKFDRYKCSKKTTKKTLNKQANIPSHPHDKNTHTFPSGKSTIKKTK